MSARARRASIDRAWWRHLAVALTATYVAVGVGLVARRAVGAFQHPASPEALLVLAVCLLVISETLRAALVDRTRSNARASRWRLVAPTMGSLMIAAAISLSGSSPIGLLTLWTLLLAEAAWAASRGGLAGWRRVSPKPPSSPAELSLDAAPEPTQPSAEPPSSAAGFQPTQAIVAADLDSFASEQGAAAEQGEAPSLDPDIVQQLVRRREPDGSEWLNGSLRVDFAPGQRVASAHVAFCPPFFRTPDCEAESVDGPDCQVKVSQLAPHGARFEVRLDRPAESAESVMLEIAVHVESPSFTEN